MCIRNVSDYMFSSNSILYAKKYKWIFLYNSYFMRLLNIIPHESPIFNNKYQTDTDTNLSRNTDKNRLWGMPINYTDKPY